MKTFNNLFERITATRDTKANLIVLLALSLITYTLVSLVVYTIENPQAVELASF